MAEEHIQNTGREKTYAGRGEKPQKRPQKGSRAWIEAKHERHLKKGMDVKHLSKYTGRKRR
jgi:18S rRNA (guanine1575-N7)-methyltransferase